MMTFWLQYILVVVVVTDPAQPIANKRKLCIGGTAFKNVEEATAP